MQKKIVTGDFNRLSTERLSNTLPSMIQIMTPPTRGQAALDVLLTNVGENVADIQIPSKRPPGSGQIIT